MVDLTFVKQHTTMPSFSKKTQVLYGILSTSGTRKKEKQRRDRRNNWQEWVNRAVLTTSNSNNQMTMRANSNNQMTMRANRSNNQTISLVRIIQTVIKTMTSSASFAWTVQLTRR